MNKNITIKEDNNLVLSKAKSLMTITNKILSNNQNNLTDDSWVDRLWAWADENEISDYEWIEGDEVSYWVGLPRDKNKLLELTELSLYSLKTELSIELSHLIKLKKLDINFYSYTKLPKEIFNLKELTHLTFSQLHQYEANKLRLIEVAKEIKNLTNLIELDISHNNIIKLPNNITKLINITKLDISYNEIKELPLEIGDLINLESFILNDNQLKELPISICNLTNLKYLVLDDNPDLILSKEQTIWINKLKDNKCTVLNFLDFKKSNGYSKYFNSPT